MTLVAGGNEYDDAGGVQCLDRIRGVRVRAQHGGRIVVLAAVAEAHVDHPDALCLAPGSELGDQPVQTRCDIRGGAAGTLEDLDRDEVHIGCHPERRHHAIGAEDSGHAGPVPVDVFRARRLGSASHAAAAAAEAVLGYQAIHEVGMIRIDPAVEDGHLDAGSGEAHRVCHGRADERATLGQRRVDGPVDIDHLHLRVADQRVDRCGRRACGGVPSHRLQPVSCLAENHPPLALRQ